MLDRPVVVVVEDGGSEVCEVPDCRCEEGNMRRFGKGRSGKVVDSRFVSATTLPFLLLQIPLFLVVNLALAISARNSVSKY